MTTTAATPTAKPSAAAANPQVSTLATKRVLHALALILTGQDVPRAITSTGDQQRVRDIELQQVDAAMGQLRSRYPTVALATRNLFAATTRATQWAETLVPEGPSHAYSRAWEALVAVLTRRIVIDGLAVARGTLEHCQAGLLELETRDDRWPLEALADQSA